MQGFLLSIVDLQFVHPLLRLPFARLHRMVTTGFLPEKLRDEMRLPWGPREQREFERFVLLLRVSQQLTPRVVRQLPTNLIMWDLRRRLRAGKKLV